MVVSQSNILSFNSNLSIILSRPVRLICATKRHVNLTQNSAYPTLVSHDN